MFRDTYLSIKGDSQGALRNSIALTLAFSWNTFHWLENEVSGLGNINFTPRRS